MLMLFSEMLSQMGISDNVTTKNVNRYAEVFQRHPTVALDVAPMFYNLVPEVKQHDFVTRLQEGILPLTVQPVQLWFGGISYCYFVFEYTDHDTLVVKTLKDQVHFFNMITRLVQTDDRTELLEYLMDIKKYL